MLEQQSTEAPIEALSGTASPRVALVCDLVEEHWPSMDLIAEMLFERLGEDHSKQFSTTRLRPPEVARFQRLSLPGSQPFLQNADRFAGRFIRYPRWLRGHIQNFDLFHILDHSYAQLVHCLPAARTIVTCHDLDTFRCLLEPEREKRPAWFRAMTRRILTGLRSAAHVIAVSSTTRDEIIGRGLAPPERVSVVHNGVHPSCSPLADSVADAEAARLLPADSAGAIWLLNVGSSMPRKRLDVLLRVFAAVRREVPEVRLARVGSAMTPAQRQLARELEVEHVTCELPYLTREVLAAVYRRAHLLLHTAEAEGFGLPLIEALACGCKVVASDLPVLREVGEEVVTYCAVADIAAWKGTVVDLLHDNSKGSGARELYRKQAIAHAAHFSWAENARRTAHIYQEVLNSKNIAKTL